MHSKISHLLVRINRDYATRSLHFVFNDHLFTTLKALLKSKTFKDLKYIYPKQVWEKDFNDAHWEIENHCVGEFITEKLAKMAYNDEVQ